MKNFLFFCACSTLLCALTVLATPLVIKPKQCSQGPVYWCQNLTIAHSCNAVKHCIQTVWEHAKVEQPDTDSVCQICLDMVKQARDQLESNETQEEIKQVFEGSCNLIPIKSVAKECCKLADDFIPDLIDTLASQMDPQVVCSVAGLCNNAHIDKLLAKKTNSKPNKPTIVIDLSDDIRVNKLSKDCQGCYKVVDQMQEKILTLNKYDVLEVTLKACGRLGSFSDMCANIVVEYRNEIYKALKNDFNSRSICHMSGVCSDLYHTHSSSSLYSPISGTADKETYAAVEIIPHGFVGVRNIEKDDLPCDLCTQLVGHLRDLLIANTTESEFRQVLEGLCRQTKSFKSECLNIVETYYDRIYEFLVSELNGKEACEMIGICPGTNLLESDEPVWPLLTVENAQIVEQMAKEKLADDNYSKLPLKPIITPHLMPGPVDISKIAINEANDMEKKENIKEEHLTIEEIQNAQLPIDRILPISILGRNNSEACAFCEYVLHFVQVQLTDQATDEEIKGAVEHVCKIMPNFLTNECHQFIDTYGNLIIAVIVQEIDPSQVCPMLSLCPKQGIKDVEVFITHNEGDEKPNGNCPLCLLAVTQLENMVKNEKTEEKIEDALKKLCVHLPQNLVVQCKDFVESYSHELIQMLMADLNPQEVCVYLKLCTPKSNENKLNNIIPVNTEKPANHFNTGIGDTLTNEIPDITVGGRVVIPAVEAGPSCVLCKTVAKEVFKALNGSINPDDIKRELESVCKKFPDIEYDCNEYIVKYLDKLIDLFSDAMTPEDICSILFLCVHQQVEFQNSVKNCVICEEVVNVLHMLLKNPNIDHNIEHLIKKACTILPQDDADKCNKIMSKYGTILIELLEHETNSKVVCEQLNLCSGNEQGIKLIEHDNSTPKRHLLGSNKCTWGMSYWCKSLEKAQECNALDYCQKKVWMKKEP